MEDLRKYIAKFSERKKRELLTDNQSKFNAFCVSHLSKMVHDRSNGRKQFVIDDGMLDTYSQVFKYINNDYQLESEKKHVTIQPWDLNKGLFFIGNFGRGKTLLLNFIFENRSRFKISGKECTAFDLSIMYVKDLNSFNDIVSAKYSLFLDEIGDEPKETLNFGNAENVAYRGMKLFFDKTERQSEESAGNRFFGTSNLGQKELIERYDERIWSRIVGNCNIIVFGSGLKDFRKA